MARKTTGYSFEERLAMAAEACSKFGLPACRPRMPGARTIEQYRKLVAKGETSLDEIALKSKKLAKLVPRVPSFFDGSQQVQTT